METDSVSSLPTSKMQDDQLIIVLRVEEGIHFNTAEHVLVQSTLSGNKIEAEPIKPGHTTMFDCNLVWETDKKSIKKMKTDNLPVKIEVFALKNYRGNLEGVAREHIGYILMPVKNIPMVQLSKAVTMKPRWQKIIGLSKDWRPYKPELHMNIMITTKDFLTADKKLALEPNENVVIEENPVPCMLTSQRGIFIRLLKEEGLLQVGHIDTNCDVFQVKIQLKSVKFLEENRDIFISYTLLGNLHIRPLNKKFNKGHQIHETVSINFRSSLVLLKQYFEDIFFIPFEIISGSEVLGTSEIKLSKLIKDTELPEFLKKNPTHILELEDASTIKMTAEIPPTANRPVLEYKISIQYVATKKLHQTELLESYRRYQDVDSQAGGDCIKKPELTDIQEVRSESEKSEKIKSASEKLDKVAPPPRPPSFRSVPVKPVLDSQAGVSSDLPRLFNFVLQISSLKFNRPPEKGIWQVSICHDKADIQRVFVNRQVNDTESFDDIELKLFFTSSREDVLHLIKSSGTCTLCVRGPRGTHAQAQVDMESLLIGSKEKMRGIILLQNEADDVTAMADIWGSLEELGVNFNTQFKVAEPKVQQQPENAHLDENLAYKVIEELEEWKKVQQDSFLQDLKGKEMKFLEQLKIAWNQKQAKYENELVEKTENLKQLSQSLKEAQKSIETKKTAEELDFDRLKLKLESAYNNQLLAVKERARRIEEDLVHEMKLRDIRYEDIERCSQHLEKENSELRQKIKSLQCELNELKGNLVPREEVERLLREMRLLKDKCESIQCSKDFYKEEWTKAINECHQIRRLNIEDAKQNRFIAKCDRVCNELEDYQLTIEDDELERLKRICLNSRNDEL